MNNKIIYQEVSIVINHLNKGYVMEMSLLPAAFLWVRF